MTQDSLHTDTNSPETDTGRVGETLGSYFRKTRERQNKTLTDAAEETRIHASTLRALEEDNRKALPAEVFTRGFIKLYSQYLGIDPNEALNWYMTQADGVPHVGKEHINVSEVLSTETMAESSPFGFGRMAFYAFLILFFAYLGYVSFSGINIPTQAPETEVQQQDTAPPATIQENDTLPVPAPEATSKDQGPVVTKKDVAEEPQPVAPPKKTTKPVTEKAEEIASPPQAAVAPEPVPPAPKRETPEETTQASDKPQDEAVAAPPLAVVPPPAETTGEEPSAMAGETSENMQERDVPADRYTLEADFVELTWLRLEIDDNGPREFTFQPGDSVVWKAARQFKLFLGNAGGIALTLNGEPLPPVGRSGKTARITLPKNPQQ